MSCPQNLRKGRDGYAKLSRKFKAAHHSGKIKETRGKSNPNKLFLLSVKIPFPQKEVALSILISHSQSYGSSTILPTIGLSSVMSSHFVCPLWILTGNTMNALAFINLFFARDPFETSTLSQKPNLRLNNTPERHSPLRDISKFYERESDSGAAVFNDFLFSIRLVSRVERNPLAN